MNKIKRGWWKLEISGVDELTNCDQEHIAEKIKEGYNQGEIVQEEENDESENPDVS